MKVEMKNKNQKIPDWLLSEVNNKLLAKLLYNRGVDTKFKLKKFLYPAEYIPTSPKEFENMEKGIKRIIKAVEKNEKIVIYGDYDVDGVTSTAILVSFLRKLDAKIDYHIPDRFDEGYGMNKNVIKKMVEDDVDLILSCDCGISNFDEIKLAKNLGMDVIVTDHHDLPENLPPADIILTPKFFAKEHQAHDLPGAGMVYYLVKGIMNFINKNKYYKNLFEYKIKADYYLDYLALAIVADVVPLKGENRFLLQKGLKNLKTTDKKSLNELFEMSGINKELISEEDIAFRIAPIINAAGRIEDAKIAVEMLLTKDKIKVKKLSNKLIKINSRRKEIQEKIIKEAEEILKSEEDFQNKGIILYQPHWHEGLLGIAAGRLTENYKIPAFLMTLKEDKGTITGSARSIPEIHVNNKLKNVKNHLLKSGGHAGAAGFSLKRDQYTIFKKKLASLLENDLSEISREETIKVDAQLKLGDIDLDMYNDIRKLAPFGEENEKPLFMTNNCQLLQSRNFGDNNHKRLILKQNNNKITAIWWWAGEQKIPKNLDLIYHLDINRFRGRENIQLVIKEVIDSDYSYKFSTKDDFTKFIKIKDYRNWQNNKKLKNDIYNFENAVYYQEGNSKIYFDQIIDRYGIGENDKLVLISFPPSLSILYDLIYNNEPSEIILAFDKNKLKENENFLKKVMSFLKYILKEKNGYFKIPNIAVLTEELEVTIKVTLKYLEASGYIELEKINENNYFIKRGGKTDKGKKRIYKKRLKSLLKESKSFKNFLYKTNSEEILRYVKNS
ncbi:MAG: single-stranded-DNA-specific exonuclease RecJ [Bacillota bacterium]